METPALPPGWRWELVMVTPKKAADLLAHNTGNRALRERRAAGLARSMLAGRWKLTHQAVAISPTGRLLDGQHRLRAVILANVAVPMWIAHNVPDTTFDVLDAGLPRKMFERLQSNPRHTSMVTTLWRLMGSRDQVQEWECELLLDVLKPSIDRLDTIVRPSRGNKLGKAPIEAAVCLRIGQELHNGKEGDAGADERIMQMCWQLTQLRRGETLNLPPVLGAYYIQMCEGVKNYGIGVSPMTDEFCRTWSAFDPSNAQNKRLLIADHSGVVKEARQIFSVITEKVFEE